ncbi:MAG: hypothetical protein ACRD0A_20015 [Acidimicrobiales bacterium]
MKLRNAVVGVGLLTAAWCAAAAPARATFGSRTAADEPQYLLSALSLWEDGDLAIDDELAAERWRDFHEAALPEQTRPLDDGRRLSPHDPLLAVVLAAPVGLGGWLGAKLAMAAMAGLLAAVLVWVAVRRFTVPVAVAGLTVLAFSLAAPLVVYGAQIYPELPAALVVTIAIAALTGPLRRRGLAVLWLAVVVLPWLSVKYAPVAAGLALIGFVMLVRRGRWRAAVVGAAILAGAGLAYVGFHRAVYGGWTVYAAGDHFVGGELTAAGSSPNYGGRSVRLVGLLTDRVFGLLAWAPGWLLAVPAVAAVLRRRPHGWAAIVVPAAVGWLVATFVALTMHGYWWPGRQVVVILPALVLATAWWLATATGRWPRAALVGAAAVGVATWAWLLVELWAGRLAVIFGFELTGNPWYRVWHVVLPDYRRLTSADWVLHGAWILAIGLLVVAGWRSLSIRSAPMMKETSTDDHPMGPAGGRRDAGDLVGSVGVR